ELEKVLQNQGYARPDAHALQGQAGSGGTGRARKLGSLLTQIARMKWSKVEVPVVRASQLDGWSVGFAQVIVCAVPCSDRDYSNVSAVLASSRSRSSQKSL